jgi:hypothetical protein
VKDTVHCTHSRASLCTSALHFAPAAVTTSTEGGLSRSPVVAAGGEDGDGVGAVVCKGEAHTAVAGGRRVLTAQTSYATAAAIAPSVDAGAGNGGEEAEEGGGGGG